MVIAPLLVGYALMSCEVCKIDEASYKKLLFPDFWLLLDFLVVGHGHLNPIVPVQLHIVLSLWPELMQNLSGI